MVVTAVIGNRRTGHAWMQVGVATVATSFAAVIVDMLEIIVTGIKGFDLFFC